MTSKRERGFTLIELMIVVAIIGILAAIAIPNFIKFQAKSKQSEAKTNLKAIFTAEKSYYGERDAYNNTFAAACCAFSPVPEPPRSLAEPAAGVALASLLASRAACSAF